MANVWIFDNVQHFHKQRDFRIGRENSMIIGIAGTFSQFRVDLAALDISDKRDWIIQSHRAQIIIDKLHPTCVRSQEGALPTLPDSCRQALSSVEGKRYLPACYEWEERGLKHRIEGWAAGFSEPNRAGRWGLRFAALFRRRRQNVIQ
ncbi:hypothetical protein B0H11DRAFT_1942223 [Mycena galericulata]|nr:hypothetical protein B0H11DRAFT_1942223 [Mycena galericulata]